MNKFKLIEVKFIDMFHFHLYEGKFQDMEQKEYQNRETYVYANVSDFETRTFEESDVRVYAHSFETLYCAEDYELYNFDVKTLNFFKEEILKEIKKEGRLSMNTDEIRIVGFVFEHGAEDYSLWETDAISDEDQQKLYEILQKYDTTGTSVRNCYKQIMAIE